MFLIIISVSIYYVLTFVEIRILKMRLRRSLTFILIKGFVSVVIGFVASNAYALGSHSIERLITRLFYGLAFFFILWVFTKIEEKFNKT